MGYDVVFKPKVRKRLVRLPEHIYERAGQAISNLADDPRPSGARKMRGTGEHRVVYRVDDGARAVVVPAVGHRGSVYG